MFMATHYEPPGLSPKKTRAGTGVQCSTESGNQNNPERFAYNKHSEKKNG